jgi:SAM-dependent methyltransferase
MSRLTQYLFHLVCRKDVRRPEGYNENYFQNGFDETIVFFRRLGNQVDFTNKHVLDVGCGYGSTCIYLAQHGARQVLGIDIEEERIAFAKEKLHSTHANLLDRVDFKVVTATEQLEGQKFDIVISKDSFEHIGNPKQYLLELQEHVAGDGIIVIGFGPLWKSPHGGHMAFMTRFPWMHLLFSEEVIMHERKRFRPEENAETFEQVKGGLNKMTLKKFMDSINGSKLEPLYFKTNVHEQKLTKVFTMLSYIPFCKEYFTFNLYSIWRLKPQYRQTPDIVGEEQQKTGQEVPLT